MPPLLQITRLELTNFKQFEHFVFEPQPGVNLIVGTNGSGKTSLLKGLCVALGAFFIDIGKDVLYIKDEYLRLDDKGYTSEKTTVYAEGILNSKGISNWKRSRSKNGKTDRVGAFEIREYSKDLVKGINSGSSQKKLPIIAYYSSQRLFSDRKTQAYSPNEGRYNGYYNCLSETSNKEYISDWLKKAATDAGNKARQGIIDEPDTILLNVEFLLVELAKDIFNSGDNYKIYYDSKFDDLMLKLDSQPSLPISFYSDGYRNLMWLFMDLAWRASELNPFLGVKAITDAEGVVLIDEIDLHLHPQWQRKAIGLLQTIFPGIQFFITTHSPIVVSSFKGSGLFQMSHESIHEIESYFGKDINETATNLMEVSARDEEVQEKLQRYLTLIGNNEFTNPETVTLRSELDDLLEENNEDLVRADLIIELSKGK